MTVLSQDSILLDLIYNTSELKIPLLFKNVISKILRIVSCKYNSASHNYFDNIYSVYIPLNCYGHEINDIGS